MTATTKVGSGAYTGESPSKRTYGDEQEGGHSDGGSDPLEKPNARGKGKRQKTAAASNEEPTAPSNKNKGVVPPHPPPPPPPPSPPSLPLTKKASSSFMTRKEAEMVFDMVVESANWTTILKELNTGGANVPSTRNLKRHFTTVLKKQALSGYS